MALFDMANPAGGLLSGMTAQAFFVTESASAVLAMPFTARNEARIMGRDGVIRTFAFATGLRSHSKR